VLTGADISVVSGVRIRPVGLVPLGWDGEGTVEYLAGDPASSLSALSAHRSPAPSVTGQGSLPRGPRRRSRGRETTSPDPGNAVHSSGSHAGRRCCGRAQRPGRRPVSSCSSRRAASIGVSPGSMPPPGGSQMMVRSTGSRHRSSRTRSAESTHSTRAAGRCRGDARPTTPASAVLARLATYADRADDAGCAPQPLLSAG
jgi:hypothetical protein